MSYYLVTMENGRQFGVMSTDIMSAFDTGIKVIKETYFLDDDLEIKAINHIPFYNTDGEVLK